MSRDICIFQSFLTPAHKAQITAAAEAAGMTPYFFTKDPVSYTHLTLPTTSIV